jgi:flagellar biosynthesis component FlhA
VGLAYHIVRQGSCKPQKFRSTEFVLCLMSIMPPSQAALRRALVRAMAFAHHKAQEKIEKTAPRDRRDRQKPALTGPAKAGLNWCQST